VPCNFYRELGENMADDELRAMIDEFDRDGDGESTLQLLICNILKGSPPKMTFSYIDDYGSSYFSDNSRGN
jgi:hypothetical protein